MNFTWESLQAAQTAFRKLKNDYLNLAEGKELDEEFVSKFASAIDDDLNMSKALSYVWELLKSDSPNKKVTISKFDEVLGLGLGNLKKEHTKIPGNIRELVSRRDDARKTGNYDRADEIRGQIEEAGYVIQDSSDGTVVKSK